MKELAKNFPEGINYEIDYDPHGIRAQFHRGGGAHLVRGGPAGRARGGRRIPADLARQRHSAGAVPVAIIGTLAVPAAGGLFDQSLTLFGLVLATGIVVDDAIVVVENIERKIEQGC